MIRFHRKTFGGSLAVSDISPAHCSDLFAFPLSLLTMAVHVVVGSHKLVRSLQRVRLIRQASFFTVFLRFPRPAHQAKLGTLLRFPPESPGKTLDGFSGAHDLLRHSPIPPPCLQTAGLFSRWRPLFCHSGAFPCRRYS